jgi:hypothetical protein
MASNPPTGFTLRDGRFTLCDGKFTLCDGILIDKSILALIVHAKCRRR